MQNEWKIRKTRRRKFLFRIFRIFILHYEGEGKHVHNNEHYFRNYPIGDVINEPCFCLVINISDFFVSNINIIGATRVSLFPWRRPSDIHVIEYIQNQFLRRADHTDVRSANWTGQNSYVNFILLPVLPEGSSRSAGCNFSFFILESNIMMSDKNGKRIWKSGERPISDDAEDWRNRTS